MFSDFIFSELLLRPFATLYVNNIMSHALDVLISKFPTTDLSPTANSESDVE